MEHEINFLFSFLFFMNNSFLDKIKRSAETEKKIKIRFLRVCKQNKNKLGHIDTYMNAYIIKKRFQVSFVYY